MSRKRRRKRAQASRAPVPAVATADASIAEPEIESKKPERRGSQPRGWGRFLQSGGTGSSPFPPLGLSLAQGFRAVGASPAILALAFLATFGGWAAFSAVGADPSPPGLVVLLALPPIHAFLDVALIRVVAEETAWATGLVFGLGAVRAVVVAMLALLVVGAMRDGAVDVRAAIRALPKTALTVFLIIAIELAAVVTIPGFLQTLLGPQLAFLITAVLGLHFLVFAPVIAAAEGGRTADALRRSFRATRLRGPRHFLLVLAYFSFVFWAANIVGSAGSAPATPTISTWAFALLASFVHTAVLGALAFRWLAVRDLVATGGAKGSAGT
ncbi:MAG TPA: hypothetical protein VFH75_06980 [Actinomycetota bacterium]|nr:hypothetical protein [Actinomycetota bacterium]